MWKNKKQTETSESLSKKQDKEQEHMRRLLTVVCSSMVDACVYVCVWVGWGWR